MSTQTFERSAARTMSDALAALRQNEQVDRVHPIVAAAPVRNERLPLATAVRFQRRHETVIAVVSGHNPNDRNRVRVSWFDDRLREVKHRWADADGLVVLESKAASR